jgi:hypothetical protein
MTHEVGMLSEPRLLSHAERELTAWLLRHGSDDAGEFLPQLDRAKVIAHCRCGCASIDFSIDGRQPKTFGMRVLSDYQWKDQRGHLFGVMVFEQDDLLAGLDVWSIDGGATPYELPPIQSLVPYGSQPDNLTNNRVGPQWVGCSRS